MKINWKSVPLLQLVMPFILGFTIYRFTHFYSDLLFVSSILCISALYLLLDYNSYRFRWFYTLFVHFFVVQFAIILCHFSLNKNKANYFTNYANEESIYLIEIIDYVKQKENSIELLARIKSVDSIKTSAKILIYMQKQSDNPIDKGSLLITTSKPTQLQASPNPYQLNYKSYLNRKGLIVNSNFELLKSDSLIEVDYCLLSKNIDLNELYDSYTISLLLLDASLPYYTSKKLENQSKKMGLNFHNLKSESLIEYF